MIVFAVSGKAESGKDTFYSLLANVCADSGEPLNVCRLAFADKVKECARAMGWNGEKDENGRTGLIMVGDGAREYFDKDVWIKKLINSLEDKKNIPNLIVVVTDCRYPNEVDELAAWSFFNEHDFYAVRVERSNHVSRLTKEQLENASEVALDDYAPWNYIIENTGTLEDYAESVRTICKDVGILKEGV